MIKIYKIKKLEQIKEEYNFDEIKDAFDKVKILPQLDFFFWRRQG